MRILHVTSGLNMRSGGPVSALASMARAQAQAACAVTVASAYAAGEQPEVRTIIEQSGVNLALLGPTSSRLWLKHDLRGKLAHLVATADAVHIHGLWEPIQHEAAKAAQRQRIPFVITPHGMLSRWALAQNAAKKKFYLAWRMQTHLNRSAAIHFTSVKERSETAIALRARTIVEPLAIDLAEFDAASEEGAFRRRIHIDPPGPLIVFLGRIHPGKGVEHLIPALAHMRNREAVLAVVGPDSNGFRAEMEESARRHEVASRVIFTGALHGADRVAALRDADIFSLPSDHENFGMSVIEALAAGTPVVISDGVAVAPEIQAAGVGSVVGVKDVDALARELDAWLSDAPRRQLAGGKARAFVHSTYGLEASGRRWRAHYQTLVAEAGSRP